MYYFTCSNQGTYIVSEYLKFTIDISIKQNQNSAPNLGGGVKYSKHEYLGVDITGWNFTMNQGKYSQKINTWLKDLKKINGNSSKK